MFVGMRERFAQEISIVISYILYIQRAIQYNGS